jgi:hypothetical protein
LPPRTEAVWDRAARAATCLDCARAGEGGAAFESEEPPAGPLPLDRGEAGASARRKYERLHERREKQARDRLGRLSGIYLALTDDPQSTRAWGVGSSGERSLGAYLDTLNDDKSLIVLHDRRVPGTRANVDHLAISRAGIFVIDAKNYTGRVQKIDKGGWFSTDMRLYVGRRDCTKLVAGMRKQVDAVRKALGQAVIHEFSPPITPVLCFVDAEWSLFSRPFQLEGVWVEWSKSLGERLRAPGSFAPEHVQLLARKLATALPSA